MAADSHPTGTAEHTSDQEPGSTLTFACHTGFESASEDNTVTYVCDGTTGDFQVASCTAESGCGSCTAITCDGRASAVNPPNAVYVPLHSTATQAASQPFGERFGARSTVFCCPWSKLPLNRCENITGSSVVFQCTRGFEGFLSFICGTDSKSPGLFMTTDECTTITCDGSSVSTPENARPLQVAPHDTLAARQQPGQPYNSHLVFP